MSLQSIVNASNGLTINRRKVVGIQYTRNEIPRVSLTPTLNPWRFTLDLPTSFQYSEVRDILENVDKLDRIYNEVISFGNNINFRWMFSYRGQMTQSQINNLTVVSFDGNQLTLTGLPPISPTKILFEPNDLIQIGDNPYPFTVVNQVQRGLIDTVTLTTHRPNILTADIVGDSLTVGTDCQFNMFVPNMPTYKLFPSGSIRLLDGTIVNNALIEWSSAFEFYEYLGEA